MVGRLDVEAHPGVDAVVLPCPRGIRQPDADLELALSERQLLEQETQLQFSRRPVPAELADVLAIGTEERAVAVAHLERKNRGIDGTLTNELEHDRHGLTRDKVHT